MKSCISTYSFERLYQDGGFTRFDAIDKTKEYGCQGVELVLDDKTPDGSTPMEYAKALYAHAKEQGLEVPIYTTGANFFVKEPEKELERLCRHIDIAAECKIPLLRHTLVHIYRGITDFQKSFVLRIGVLIGIDHGARCWALGKKRIVHTNNPRLFSIS